MAVLSEKLRMDSNGTSITNGVASVLTYAACEWFLIFLMFIDAFLSYLLVWFARYCRLQLPCFLCSKLHHRLQWRSLLCASHRSEVSSFISCQIHDNNLAHCRAMCDDCLLSFTKKTTPNPDMLQLENLGFDLPMESDFAQRRPCSCCGKPWRTRHNSARLLQPGISGRNSAIKPNVPVPRRIGRRGSLKKMRDHKRTVAASDFVSGKNGGSDGGGDGIAHVGYRELKITSNAESEFPFSDEDGFLSMNEFQVESSEKPAVDSRSHKLFEDKIYNHKQPDMPDSQNKSNVKDEKIVEASRPELILLNDVRQESVQADKNTTVLCQLIPLVPGDVTGTESEKQNGAGASNNSEATSHRDEQTTNSPIREPTCENRNHLHDSEYASGSVVKEEVCDAVVEHKVSDFVVPEDVSGFVAKEQSSKEECGFNEDLEPLKLHKVSGSSEKDGFNEEYEVNADSEPLTLHSVSGSAAKDAFKEDEGNNVDSEPLTLHNVSGSAKEENGLNEDLEPSKLRTISGSVPTEHSNKEEENELKEDSKPHGNDESSKAIEVQSISVGTPKLNHSAYIEYFDGSINSDIEGENLVDLLKRQVEHDRKCLRDLQKELEEERSASAIAADEAMAMITRLQEEKAALHMEALHYLRMMDEQAEYDVDALEKADDLLAEKEKEIQDLETELEYYRLKFPDGSREEAIGKGMVKLKASMDANGTHTPSFIRSSSLGIEKEKVLISDCLRNLEEKLYQFTSGSSHRREAVTSDRSLETEGDCLGRHEDEGPMFNGETSTEEATNYPDDKCRSVSVETDCNTDKNKLIRFENEISGLKNRLETLRADRDFLERSVTTLEKGKDGLEFIQEIAHQLQELRNLGIWRR